MTRWLRAPLGDVLVQDTRYFDVPEQRTYKKLSVRLYGKGVALDAAVDGSELRMPRHQIAKSGQVILSEIWGKKGAIGLVPPDGDGALCTSHFFLFDVLNDKVDPGWLGAIFSANYLQEQLDVQARGTTGYAAVRPRHLLEASIPLPPLPEQRRIVARIEELNKRIDGILADRARADDELARLVRRTYLEITKGAPRRPLGEVAPLTRRPAEVSPAAQYPQVAVRSFGRGTFQRPPLQGSEITWEKPFLVRGGDILISNIKAWEGAVAVAAEADDGRFGSHRYLTLVPVERVADGRFICYHLLTPGGLKDLGEASPGSADRNRTLGVEKLKSIEVPVPVYDEQIRFANLLTLVDRVRGARERGTIQLAALLPASLGRTLGRCAVPP